jgi:hypothetical protein
MKRRIGIVAAWLATVLVLIALSAANIIQNIQQSAWQHWEQEVARFLATVTFILLISAGAKCELRRPPES